MSDIPMALINMHVNACAVQEVRLEEQENEASLIISFLSIFASFGEGDPFSNNKTLIS